MTIARDLSFLEVGESELACQRFGFTVLGHVSEGNRTMSNTRSRLIWVKLQIREQHFQELEICRVRSFQDHGAQIFRFHTPVAAISRLR